ncbi:hypothetical protein [Acinetobacter larvae]|uniref:Uncharacterized protein n=1 Tax=Acinetobacter larvae TaxID=1789224 RepID=A0A1B2LYZ4_9GAMM|nr:hypothetical protein [Acinetobacter larvae]AOA58178.1 hypothetical protein BFG52_07315 [Acinetobacter larvae]
MDIQKERAAFELAYIASRKDCPLAKSDLLEYDGSYLVSRVNDSWNMWLHVKAHAVPEGFVLVPKESLKVALSWMDDDIDPWQMGGDSFAQLYEHKPILEKAMIEAAEVE